MADQSENPQMGLIDGYDSALGVFMMWVPLLIGAVLLTLVIVPDTKTQLFGSNRDSINAAVISGVALIVFSYPMFSAVQWFATKVVGLIPKIFGDKYGTDRPYIIDMMGRPTYVGLILHAGVAALASVLVLNYGVSS
jgi:hypothetical protein